MAIQNDDLILVNRGGVDYKAKIEDIPTEDVDLSEYAKLDDNQQHIVAYEYTTINPNSRLEPGGLYSDNVFASRGGNIDGGKISGHTIEGHGDDATIYNFKQVLADEFIGDGSQLTNLPGADVDLSEYAKIEDEQQRITAYMYTTINPNVRLEPSGLYTDNAFVNGSVSANHLTVGSITGKGEETIVGNFKTIEAGEFHGDGSNLTNLPAPDLSEYAKLSDNGQNITAYAFKTVNPGSYIDPSGVYAPNVNVGAGGSVTTSTLTTDSISCGTGSGSITNFKTVSATEFIGDGSHLTNLPIPVVEGNVLFKGSVETETDLPATDNKVGDMWHVNDDDSLHAWGEDGAWHEVGASTNIDLSEYAKLNDQNQNIVAYDYTTVNPNAYFGPGYASMEKWRAFTGFIRSGLSIGALDTSDPDDEFGEVADWSPQLYLSPSQIGYLDAEDENGVRKELFGVDSAGMGSFAGGVRVGGTYGNPEIDLLPDGTAEFSGTVTATEFHGDGSNLTGVMPLDLRTLNKLS